VPGVTDEGPGGMGDGSTTEGGASGSDVSSLSDAGLPAVPEPIVFGDYSVLCDDRNNGQTSSAQFSVALTLVNNTEEWIPIEELSVRYYFTSDNEHDPTLQGHLVFIDDASPTFGERNNVLSEVSPLDPAEEGAEYYVELSFGAGNCSGAPCLWPGNETSGDPVLEQRPIQLRVQIDPSALRYDLTDDYSYNPDANNDVLCENITLYRNGRLIFGVEPDGTVPEPLLDGGLPQPVDGGIDAGPSVPPDAGPPVDAGTSLDASTPGIVDAGPDLDASLPDAGAALDAGPLADASATATATP
jgi:hypothetical protein